MRSFAIFVLFLFVNVCGFSSHGELGPEFLVNSTTGPTANKSVVSKVAVNSSGQAVIAWVALADPSTTLGNIFVSTRDSSGNWSAPRQVNATSGGSANISRQPQVAINNSGEILVAWQTSLANIYASSRNSSGSWSSEQRINATSGGSADASGLVSVALNNSGNAVISWVGFGILIYASSRNSSTSSWSEEQQISSWSGQSQFVVKSSVALNDSGQAVICWNDFDYAYISSRDSATGDWSGQVRVNNTQESQSPFTYMQVALNNSGAAIVVWFTQFFSWKVFVSSRDSATGNWSTPEQISTTPRPVFPDVAINDSGSAVIAWYEWQLNRSIFAATRNSTTGSWSSELQINNSTFAPTIFNAVTVAMNNSGAAVITWFDINFNIYDATRESTTGSWSSEQQINATSGGSANISRLPQVAMNNSGQTIITWYTDLVGNQNIYASETPIESNKVDHLYNISTTRSGAHYIPGSP